MIQCAYVCVYAGSFMYLLSGGNENDLNTKWYFELKTETIKNIILLPLPCKLYLGNDMAW